MFTSDYLYNLSKRFTKLTNEIVDLLIQIIIVFEQATFIVNKLQDILDKNLFSQANKKIIAY